MTTQPQPYEQVRREILEQVRTGELRPGDRLPAIRTHAAALGLAAGTVARAYKLLEEAEIILTRRGAGTTIAPGAADRAEREAAGLRRDGQSAADPALVALFTGPVGEAREQGRRDVEILAAVREALTRDAAG